MLLNSELDHRAVTTLQRKYGFTPERLAEEARAQVARAGGTARRITAREDRS